MTVPHIETQNHGVASWFWGILPTDLVTIAWIDCSHFPSADVLGEFASRSSRMLMHERSCIDSFLFSGQWSGDCKTHMCWAERTICDPMFFIHESFPWINVRINVSAILFLEILEVKQTIGPRSNSRRQWFLLDKLVNSKCLVGLLGMGQDRLQRIMEGRWDKRRSWGFAAQKMCEVFFSTFQIFVKKNCPTANRKSQLRVASTTSSGSAANSSEAAWGKSLLAKAVHGCCWHAPSEEAWLQQGLS